MNVVRKGVWPQLKKAMPFFFRQGISSELPTLNRKGGYHGHMDKLNVLASHPAASKKMIGVGQSIRILDLVSGRKQNITLVSPAEDDPGHGKVSVLSPLGTAILAAGIGDLIDVEMFGVNYRIKILEVPQGEEIYDAHYLSYDY